MSSDDFTPADIPVLSEDGPPIVTPPVVSSPPAEDGPPIVTPPVPVSPPAEDGPPIVTPPVVSSPPDIGTPDVSSPIKPAEDDPDAATFRASTDDSVDVSTSGVAYSDSDTVGMADTVTGDNPGQSGNVIEQLADIQGDLLSIERKLDTLLSSLDKITPAVEAFVKEINEQGASGIMSAAFGAFFGRR